MDLNYRDKALVHYTIGEIYSQLDSREKAIVHLSKALIYDIKNSTKENLSIIELADLYFEKGKIKSASIIVKKANQDANFYGARQRKLKVGSILPLIENQIVRQKEHEKEILYRKATLLTILVVSLLILSGIIFWQMRKVRKAKKAISQINKELQAKNEKVIAARNRIDIQNDKLKKLNGKLVEINKIKEESIGFYITQNLRIFRKFTIFKNEVNKGVRDKNLQKLNYTINSLELRKEKLRSIRDFDRTFINLFPNFVDEFNSLLKPDKKIILEKGQLLNRELRIFALIRLGVNQNNVIAEILGYSVNSIYAYKTRIRRKSTLSKTEFDRNLIKNTTLKA